LDTSSKLSEGDEGELWLDSSRLHLFDPDSGERISELSHPSDGGGPISALRT
jgi:multiple sugar transport system ATP-binding protein